MPVIETVPGVSCDPKIVYRFAFNRKQGPGQGWREIGTYYKLSNGSAASSMGIGLFGFLTVNGRTPSVGFLPIARANTVPKLTGEVSELDVVVEQLLYIGRNLHEVEMFLGKAMDNLGMYEGSLNAYHQTTHATISYHITNCYPQGISYNWDGKNNAVEYAVSFKSYGAVTTGGDIP